MKKNILLTFMFFAVCLLTTQANNSSVNIDGKIFELKYSNCKQESVACMNEYYKAGEKGFRWSELFTVVYAKSTDDPILFASKLADMQKYSDLSVNKHENYAIVRFLIPFQDKNKNNFVEQNIAKVMKYKYGKGVVSQQYAVRISMSGDKADLERTLRENEAKYTELIKRIPCKKVYEEPLENW